MKKVGLRLALALALTSGCTSSPAGPSETPEPAVAPNPLTQTGTWTGFFRIDTCTAAQEGCATSVGRLLPFSLRTTPLGTSLAGVFTTEWAEMPVSVSGQLDTDGSARFTGTLMSVPPAPVYEAVKVTSLHVAANPASGLSGTVSLSKRTSYQREQITGTIVSASMQPFVILSDRQYQGTWEGRGVIKSCRGDCWFYTPGSWFSVVLRATQSGSAVTGELSDIRVAGQVAGGMLNLAGEVRRTIVDDDGFTLRRLEAFTATSDGLGRLTGRFRIRVEGLKSEGFVRKPFAGTFEVEMVTVVRRF